MPDQLKWSLTSDSNTWWSEDVKRTPLFRHCHGTAKHFAKASHSPTHPCSVGWLLQCKALFSPFWVKYLGQRQTWLKRDLSRQPFGYWASLMFPSIHAVFIPDSLHDLSYSCCCVQLHLTIFYSLKGLYQVVWTKAPQALCVCVCVNEMKWEWMCGPSRGLAALLFTFFFSPAKSPLIFSLQHTVHPALWPFLSVSALRRNTVCSPT